MRFPDGRKRVCKLFSFSIYMGNPVGYWFGQIENKIQDWYISLRNRVYRFHKSVHLPKNGRGRLKLVSKMKNEFPFGTFRLPNGAHTFHSEIPFGNFGLPIKKSRFPGEISVREEKQ